MNANTKEVMINGEMKKVITRTLKIMSYDEVVSRVVLATVWEDENHLRVAYAYCSPLDIHNFDKAKGKMIALNRLITPARNKVTYSKIKVEKGDNVLDLIKSDLLITGHIRGIKWLNGIYKSNIK